MCRGTKGLIIIVKDTNKASIMCVGTKVLITKGAVRGHQCCLRALSLCATHRGHYKSLWGTKRHYYCVNPNGGR